MTLEENLAEVESIVQIGDANGIDVEAGLGTSFYCPFEGKISPEKTLDIVDRVLDIGVDNVTLATTMGLADPQEVAEMFTRLFDRHPREEVGLHLHDTNGLSLVNALIAMACGVDRFDASVCGLGGGTVLPPGVENIGNVPTEDLTSMLDSIDVNTVVDAVRIREVADEIADRLGLGTPSRTLMGGNRSQILDYIAEAEP
jgi:hydroxymethylglutaryl-CoA lyase